MKFPLFSHPSDKGQEALSFWDPLDGSVPADTVSQQTLAVQLGVPAASPQENKPLLGIGPKMPSWMQKGIGGMAEQALGQLIPAPAQPSQTSGISSIGSAAFQLRWGYRPTPTADRLPRLHQAFLNLYGQPVGSIANEIWGNAALPQGQHPFYSCQIGAPPSTAGTTPALGTSIMLPVAGPETVSFTVRPTPWLVQSITPDLQLAPVNFAQAFSVTPVGTTSPQNLAALTTPSVISALLGWVWERGDVWIYYTSGLMALQPIRSPQVAAEDPHSFQNYFQSHVSHAVAVSQALA